MGGDLLKLVNIVSNVQTYRNVIVEHFDEAEDARRQEEAALENGYDSERFLCLEGAEETRAYT